MRKRGQPQKSILEKATDQLRDQTRRNKIIAAIEKLAQQTASREAEAGYACRACYHPHVSVNCPLCGWNKARPCAETTRRKYLIALACCAVSGIWAVPLLRELRFGGRLSLQALTHLTKHQDQADTITEAVEQFFRGINNIIGSHVWPGARGKGKSIFELYEPHALAEAFRSFDNEAWRAFLKARWEDHAVCPRCGERPTSHGYQSIRINGVEKRACRRWRCLTKAERVLFNARRRESRPRQTLIRRTIPSRHQGCGERFTDVTNTVFEKRAMPVADCTMLYIGHVYAVCLLQAIGTPPKITIDMICGLCRMAKNEPGLLEKRRWFLQLAPVIAAVVNRCEEAQAYQAVSARLSPAAEMKTVR